MSDKIKEKNIIKKGRKKPDLRPFFLACKIYDLVVISGWPNQNHIEEDYET